MAERIFAAKEVGNIFTRVLGKNLHGEKNRNNNGKMDLGIKCDYSI